MVKSYSELKWRERSDLIPIDGRKSFYHKAQVTVGGDGTRYLWSYGTLICSMDVDGTIHKHWSGWTATTGRHIKSFVGKSISKKLWLEMAFEFAAECA